MPGLHDALAARVVSAAHVDAVVRAADRLEPDERAELVELTPALVDAASSKSVAAFERETRKLAQLLSRDAGIGHHERLRRQRSLRRPDGTVHTNDSTVNVAPDGVRPELTDLQRLMGEAVDNVIARARRVA